MKTQLKNSETVRRYSQAFRRKVLLELTEGKYTKNEVIRLYGMNPATLYDWIRKSKRLDLLNPRVRIEMVNEKDKIKELQARVKDLEGALAQTQLEHLKSEAYLSVVMEELGYSDKSELPKKSKAKRSKRR